MKNIVIGFFALALAVSCGAAKTSSSVSKVGKAQPSIANTKWVLAENVRGNVPTLNIEASKLNGNAGCNRYFGGITMETASGMFKASQLGSTKMACDNMSVENNFLDMLGKANKYVITGNLLELYQDNLLLLKFNKSE